MNILITGATGNIGLSLIHEICKKNDGNQLFAGVRDIEKAKKIFHSNQSLHYRQFDFENPSTFVDALEGMDLLFLLRPPHLSNINKVFKPLFDNIKNSGITKIVFLSVQGAESSDIIPHRKIEKLILEYQINHIFVRPSYFMQNLTTTLMTDIAKYRSIMLPAKIAKFNWVDIENITEICSIFLLEFDAYKNNAYDVTGTENLDFYNVVDRINKITNVELTYKAVSPLRFILFKIRQRVPLGMIIVMCMLHFLPRLQKEPEISDVYTKMTGKIPFSIDDFIRRQGQF